MAKKIDGGAGERSATVDREDCGLEPQELQA
jgi:hypothetical protein